MKTWLSAAEIASLALAGAPAFKRGVVRLAAQEGWATRGGLARPRAGRGGGLEFHIELLPAEARADYVARHVGPIAVPASLAREAAAEPKADELGAPAAESRDARLALVALADRFAAQAALSRRIGDAHFCGQYNSGRIVAADWIRAAVKQCSPRTLKRWRAAITAGAMAKLAVDRGASRRETGLLDRANGGEAKTFILALLAKQPQLTAHHIRALTCERFPSGLMVDERALAMPPVRTFQRALNAWRTSYRNELRAIRDPDGFKSAVRFAARVAQPAARLNEVWQIDASPADVLLADGRHSIYVAIDVYSRRMIVLVSKTPRASAVGLLIRKSILAWGVPERIKTDNGSDFVARETQRLFAALGIEHETSAPFSPEQKGHVERAIGTLQRGLMRTLPGFVGHSVADRKIIEGRKAFSARLGQDAEDMFEVSMTAPELQAAADSWARDVYGQAPHAGLKGMTPFAVAAMAAGPVRRIEDERALDMLLAPVAGRDGMRTVTKSGIRIGGAYYLAGFLDVGATVHVRMNDADMGRAYVFSADGLQFLGHAFAPELAGVDPAAAIAAARAEQKRIIAERTADMRKEARKIRAADMAPAILRQALLAAGALAEFPKRSEPHDTPQLAAARAAQGQDVSPAHSELTLKLAAELAAEAAGPPSSVIQLPETQHHRWQRALRIETALDAGENVPADDLVWLGGYREGSEYRGFKLTYDPVPTASNFSTPGALK